MSYTRKVTIYIPNTLKKCFTQVCLQPETNIEYIILYSPILTRKHSSSATRPFSPNWYIFKSDQSMSVLVPSSLPMNPINNLKTTVV